jgi:hypothetical protein
VDTSGSNAGVQLTDEQAAPPASSKDFSFVLLWIPPLVVGFIAGYVCHALLDGLRLVEWVR